jgi:flagellar protein FliO/FliZ
MTASSGLGALLWFIAILALIPVALWLLKRTPIGGASAGGMMRSVAALPLSASQRIVTIEVGQGESRRWLVLGVTPQSITTLHTMEPGADAGAPTAPAVPPGFGPLLERLRAPRGDAGGR